MESRNRYQLHGSLIIMRAFVPLLCLVVLAETGSGLDLQRLNRHNYFVSKKGSDSGNGSAGRPWATIQHAADQVHPGDTVTVFDGVYPETIAITRGGTATLPVIFKSKNKWGAKIAPTSTVANSGYTLYFDHVSYVTVKDFEIAATPMSDSAVKFFVGAPHNSLVGNNIHDVGVSQKSCTSGAGVLIADSLETVSANWIWNIGPPRSSSFRCNQQHGIYITAGAGGVIEDNLIFETWQGWSFHLAGADISNWAITNNTVFNGGDTHHSSGGGFILDCLGGTCDHNNVSNNIFANIQNFPFYEWDDPGVIGTHNTYRGNVVYNCPSGHWRTGNLSEAVTADPQFVSYTGDENGDYRLRGGSPAAGRGSRVGGAKTALAPPDPDSEAPVHP